MAFATPRVWTTEELRRERDVAEQNFKAERAREGAGAFYKCWDDAEKTVRDALEATTDLRALDGDVLVRANKVWQVLRYFCAPPVSEEDLWTVVGKKFRNVPPDFAESTANALLADLDIRRFPWLREDRAPTNAEREAAILATTVLLAHESLKTARRGRASKGQEAQVADALANAGYTLDTSREKIDVLQKLRHMHFGRERMLDGAKCDVPCKLRDGRVLAIECKVSNGPKNGWKRLNREIGGKAERWRAEFGSQVVTAAVVAGVLDLASVEKTQNDQHVFIFWQHDLQPLLDFIASVK